MSYSLCKSESVSDEIIRILQEQAERAAAEYSRSTSRNAEEAVHETRKHVKKIRAALRLLRPVMEESHFEAENKRMQEIGRALSAVRDSEVQIELVRKLKSNEANSPSLHLLDLVLKKLIQDHQIHLQALASPKTKEKIASGLKTATNNFKELVPPQISWPDLIQGYVLIYKKGRRAFGAAQDDPDFEKLHRWRKRVKDLGYASRLLHEIWPEVLKEISHQLKVLGEYLGEEHDWAVLRRNLLVLGSQQPASPRQILIERIDERHHQLQRAAFDKGKLIYLEKSSVFKSRIFHYWETWHSHPSLAAS